MSMDKRNVRIVGMIVMAIIVFLLISWSYEPHLSDKRLSYDPGYGSRLKAYNPFNDSFNITFIVMGQPFTYSITPVSIGEWMAEIGSNAGITDLNSPPGYDQSATYINWVTMDFKKGSDSYFDHLFLEINYFNFSMSAYNGKYSMPVGILNDWPGNFFAVHYGSNVITGTNFLTYGSGKIFVLSGLYNSNLSTGPLPISCPGNYTYEPPGSITYANCSMQYGPNRVPVYWVSDFNTTDHILVTPILEIGPYFITGEPVWINIEMSYPSEM
ncbi:hypothetical protein DMB44_09105, partial [Thermoplasma sp. Kam2015]|uniref:hypothetical protein n=1 Tax=Thermoplasma sp. Kam2015 TaxID=2094122 RepID=UPI000D81A6F0